MISWMMCQKEIYNILYDAYKDGSTTSTITLNYSSVWKDQKITITSDNKMVMPDTFHPQVLSWERDMLTPAFLALIYDHPELSWLSGATYYMSYKINGISYNPSELDEDNSMVKRYNSSIYYDLYQKNRRWMLQRQRWIRSCRKQRNRSIRSLREVHPDIRP